MILHLIPDSVFTDFVINKFNHLDANNHKFLILSNTEKLIYTKSENVDIINEKSLLTKDFLQYLKSFSYIVVHSMFSRYVKKMIIKSENDLKFVWIGWGGDYYETIPKLKKTLHEKRTLELMSHKSSVKLAIKKAIKFLIPYYNISTSDIYNRVDYFAPVIYDEYDLLENILKPAHSKYIPFSYGQLENDLLNGIEDSEIQGDNILVGNSASYTNNHLDVLELLSNYDLKDKKVIVPLSYGDDRYAKEIISLGHKLLPNNFMPQIKFMKKNEYHQLISSCSICIMNHKRQQSVGNIISLLYLGSKLFLNKENIIFHFLKKEGAIIFSIEELSTESISTRLTTEEIEINRNVLRKHWSEKVVNEKYLAFINTIKQM